jgi:pimeloyl-ACP methyl ester carboxylesterase
VAAYAKHFRCIVPDNRGAGRSEKPPGPYTTAMMAKDTAGLMAAIGIERAHVSGISMGGAICQELAIRYPDRVHSLTVTSSWPRCSAYTRRIFEVFRALAATSDRQAFIRLVYLWIFTPSTHERNLDDLLRREAKVLANPYPMPLHAYEAQCDACIGHDTLERLGRIAVPTLVVVGDRDIYTPLDYSVTIAQRVPGAQLQVLSGCGHACHWEKLEEFNSATTAFMLAH